MFYDMFYDVRQGSRYLTLICFDLAFYMESRLFIFYFILINFPTRDREIPQSLSLPYGLPSIQKSRNNNTL